MIKWLLLIVFVTLSWTSAGQGLIAITPLKAFEIQGVDGQVLENIEGYLSPYLEQPLADYQAQHLLRDIDNAMQALGYYHSEVQLNTKPPSKTLFIDIQPGEPLRWQLVDVQIQGEAKLDQELQALMAKLPLKTDDIVRHDIYQATKDSIESILLERGYFDLKWLVSQIRIAKKTARAEAILQIDSGPRYRFGELVINQDTKALAYVKTLATFNQNTPYSTELLSDYNLALNATPYFAAAKVYPLIKDRKAGIIPIRVEVVDKPANSFEVGGGYSTDLGAKARFKWSKPWITDDGHFFESNIGISQHQRDITGSYVIPVDNPNNDVWRVLTGYQSKDNTSAGTQSDIWNLQLQRQWLTEDNWIRTAFIKREYETTIQNGIEDNTQMLVPGISYARKQTKGGALPYWGIEHLYSLELASDSIMSSTSLVKLRWNYAWLNSFEKKHLFFTRLEMGAIIVDDIHEVPFNMRFLAGGDQSIRGFAYQSVAPKENGELIGGKYITTGTLEYNYQFLPDWRGAVFVDAGTATNDFSEKWSVGAGVGLRYLTAIGPIRLDLAWGVSKDSKSARLSIVIGPEI